jgi:hypothetical protein
VQTGPTGGTVGAQRSTPAVSGVQGAPLQHWSANWQTWPVWMQQPGRSASQPFGHAGVTGPPKQRMMPAESGLHAEWPCTPPPWGTPLSLSQQQFCEAFTVPPPPQMLPGGLQPVPESQIAGGDPFFSLHVTS